MKKTLYILGLLILITLIIVGIKGGVKDSATKAQGPVKIGASLSLTGVAADFGEMAKKAAELAVEEINANGGIDGRKVELYIEDDQTDPKSAVSAYKKLVQVQKVDAVIGGLFDFTAQPLFPLALQDKITFISPINFVIDKTFEMNEYSFVMYPRFDKVVLELESVIKDKNINTLGMIRYESGFGESIQSTLQIIMSKLGKNPLVVDTYGAIGSSDFRTNILKIRDQKPDAVFLDMLDFDIVKYLDNAEALNFKTQLIGYTTVRDVIQNPKTDKKPLEGAIVLDWEVPSEEYRKAFIAKYGIEPRRGSDKTYDAVYVLAEAVARSKNRTDIPAYIESHTFVTKNEKSVFGPDHAIADTPIKIFEVKNGTLVEIKSN